KEVVLPKNAPEEYLDRATLWNSVEKAEPNWNSQLARKIIIALPKELSDADNISLIHEYVSKEFVDEGMVADLAIHRPHKKKENNDEKKKDEPEEDKKDKDNILTGQENIHAHIMLTMRAIDDEGEWKAKSRKELVKDKDGNIKLNKNGNPVTRKVYTTNWDDRGNAEKWRKDWENLQNKYLERAGREERVCLDSYEKQGIDLIPTVHKGPAVCAMEARGESTYLGSLNQIIEEINKFIKEIGKTLKKIGSWLSELERGAKQIDIEPKEISITNIVQKWFAEREKDRESWSNIYAIRKAASKDLEKYANTYCYLSSNNIQSLSDLDARVKEVSQKLNTARNESKSLSRQKAKLSGIIDHAELKKKLDSIHKKANVPGFGKKKYREEHAQELKEWNKCVSYLRINLPEGDYNKKAITRELERLELDSQLKLSEIKSLSNEKQTLGYIQYIIKEYIPELQPEGKPLTNEQKDVKRESIREKLNQKKLEVSAKKESSLSREHLHRYLER
ncbi:MAG: MobA/MobL family protein, partial [Lachnospiraceae bacterium]|nr:MobA/MobL family protein [Lachnospiraceae bacterium]